ncbi:MAG: alanine dehydrogenase [Nitriliruptorales bacterium]
MKVGIPQEIKDNEFRVAITPAGVRELALDGHQVIIEKNAGAGSSISDDDYLRAGAITSETAAEVWGESDLLLKVKEPLPSEYRYLREDLVLFTFLHLAADRSLTEALTESGTTAIAYETVEDPFGNLVLLVPMSEIAGRMAPQVGANRLEREHGGRGVLLGGVSGVAPAHVVVIGAGTAGRNAAWLASGMEAKVTVLDLDIDKLRDIDSNHRGRILTLVSNRLTLEGVVPQADLVIGAVLIPGAKAPLVVTEEMVRAMKPGAVIVDISIDQGGCVETSKLTTHSDPTHLRFGVVHYGVGNMPGAVPHTSTYALTNVTVPYVVRLAKGLRHALSEDPGLLKGVNAAAGEVTNQAVAEAHRMPCGSAAKLLGLAGRMPAAKPSG